MENLHEDKNIKMNYKVMKEYIDIIVKSMNPFS